MNITQIGHLALNCTNLENSVNFYRNKLGLIKKFSITYGDMLNQIIKTSKETGEEPDKKTVDDLLKNKDKELIVYMEISEGSFIELFDASNANILSNDNPTFYNHVAIMVDDIFKAETLLKKAGVPIDTPPTLGLENTWQMWSHDPDGNRIEFMQYTDKSWQLIGK